MAKPVRIESWWCVEKDDAGKTVSVFVVESVTANSDRVFFVRARDADEADRKAGNDYTARRIKRKRTEWRAAGQCTKCGRAREPGFLRCAVCMESKRQEYARKERRDRGEDVPVPTRIEALDRKRTELRLDVLREVNRRFLALPKHDFMRWLQQQLDELSARKVA